jgi:hypothetical protein
MAAICEPQRVKLICGMIAAQPELFAAADRLIERFGPIDVESEVFPFDFTRYYEAEMGAGLLRKFIALGRLIDPGRLADVKRMTNELEAEFAQTDRSCARPINLDPGYVAPSKLVLASMKDFSHRVYLGGGVYAEVTLQYRNGWRAMEWTFPDYASGRYDAFLTAVREALRRQQHEEKIT